MFPINRRERKKAFVSFLFFFILTLGVVITTVFFSFQVPLKENDKMRKELDMAENEKVFLQSFEIKMHETMNLLDSVNLTSNTFRVENEIENKVKDMTAMVNDAPASVKGICNEVIDNFSSLRLAKEQIRNFTKNNTSAENKDQKIQELQAQLTNCNNQVIQLLARPK